MPEGMLEDARLSSSPEYVRFSSFPKDARFSSFPEAGVRTIARPDAVVQGQKGSRPSQARYSIG